MEKYASLQRLQEQKVKYMETLKMSEGADEQNRIIDLVENINKRMNEILNQSSNSHIPAYD